ncbi:MAG: hypothetical protein M3417_07435 [Actinomycetota bacterium]|nr:hypothetical protein [Actinomycetota bacterium]
MFEEEAQVQQRPPERTVGGEQQRDQDPSDATVPVMERVGSTGGVLGV